MPSTAARITEPPELLQRLSSLCRARDLGALALRLAALADLVAPDLDRLEAALPKPPRDARTVQTGAAHLLELGGKRLRPICVSLASRLGRGLDERGMQLAVAVELVHAATLLHDDVVDLGEVRRGAPAARMVFGNAASIFAGDWLLVDALRRVRRADVPGVLEELFDVVEEMIFAESLQLERRGRLDTSRAEWLEIVDGKTAALFRWAMFAGARAGGLDAGSCAALERYGRHLGIAFQATDDVLDVAGDPAATGKALFVDLADGKLTYPVIVALEREPGLEPKLLEALRAEGARPALYLEIRASLERTGALDACRALAVEHAASAKDALADVPAGPARDALATVADAAVYRAA